MKVRNISFWAGEVDIGVFLFDEMMPDFQSSNQPFWLLFRALRLCTLLVGDMATTRYLYKQSMPCSEEST